MADGGLSVGKKGKKKGGKDDTVSLNAGHPAKLKSGRKQDRNAQKDRAPSSNNSDIVDGDNSNNSPDLYGCTGHFQSDFTELCRRVALTYIPAVVLRPKRPPSPIEGRGGKNKAVAQPEPEPEPLDDVNGVPIEHPPKTYITKEKFDYFTPCIQVEMDNPDKQETVTELYVRGWKTDKTMMKVFKNCLPAMDRLRTINFWQAGLCGETVNMLSTFLPLCTNLKNLTLDGNWMQEQNWSLLIDDDSSIQSLSLQHCMITDAACEGIGQALGTAKRYNTKLQSLCLSGNRISDVGACLIADGLRMNRALLSLSLANNQIGDKGCEAIAEAISRFPLTHDEVIERRRLIAEKEVSENVKLHIPGRRDRPGSVRSTHSDKNKKEKTASKKPGKDGKFKEDEKKIGQKRDTQEKLGHSFKKGGSLSGDPNKSIGKKWSKGFNKKSMHVDLDMTDSLDLLSPLLEDLNPEYDEELKTLRILGNRVLVNLNLSRNKISERGIRYLAEAIMTQHERRGSNASSITHLSDQRFNGPGLMRLCVHRNNVSPRSEQLIKLNDMMAPKHPFFKPPPSPEAETT